MSKRKHITEFAILSFADKIGLTQQHWLDKVVELDFDPHIYMIARRPKVTLEPHTLEINESLIHGVINIHRQNGAERVKFETRNLLGTTELTLECNYPYSEFKLINKNNPDKKIEMQTAMIFTFCAAEYWKFLDLEILYIGQSVGIKKKRNAVDRLKKHETLQKIYAETIRNIPDQDIWLLLFHFTPFNITSFSINSIENLSTTNDNNHINKNLHSPMTDQQFVNFTEAALIKYFQPEYNKVYKNIFPSPAHNTYKHCYDLDLNILAIEIQSGNIKCRLWSPHVEPKWTHLHMFPLHNEEERKNMFDVLE